MKNDINLFSKKIKEEIATCKKEERNVRRKEETFKTALANFKANNEEKFKVINRIRLEKLAEINKEIRLSKIELETLSKEWNNILHAYCEKHKHNYILTEVKYPLPTGSYSPECGWEYSYIVNYKCTTCGTIKSFTTVGFRVCPEKYHQTIPKEAIDDITLSKNGKTLRMIEQEIPKLREYIDYLGYLKEKMCELFGHDATIIDYDRETFKCKCCGKTMSHREYIDTYYNAIYKGVVPFYYDDSISYITHEEGETDITLPTLEAYQRTLKKKENK